MLKSLRFDAHEAAVPLNCSWVYAILIENLHNEDAWLMLVWDRLSVELLGGFKSQLVWIFRCIRSCWRLELYLVAYMFSRLKG